MIRTTARCSCANLECCCSPRHCFPTRPPWRRAARWGLEASHLQANGLLASEAVHIVLEHGTGLLRRLPLHSRDLLFENIPEHLRPELLARRDGPPSRQLLEWQMSRMERLAGVQTDKIRRSMGWRSSGGL